MVMMTKREGSPHHTPSAHGEHSPTSHAQDSLLLHANKAQDIPSPMSMLSASRPPLSSSIPSGRSSLPPSLLLQSPRSSPPLLDAVPSSPLSQSSVSFNASLSSSSAPWSAASSSLSYSRASSAMDLFIAPALTSDLPTFSTLLSPHSPTANSSQADLFSPHTNGSGLGGSDSSEGEGEEVNPVGAPARSKRRKLDEIPNRERWRCPNDGCGREYKRTSTTSIGQHKDTCAKRPVFKARAIFHLSPSLHRPAHSFLPSASLLTHAQAVGDLGRQLQLQGQVEGFGWSAADSTGLQQRESAALLGGLGGLGALGLSGSSTSQLQVQAAALLLAQQHMQQQTAQQLQALRLQQQQQSLLQQQLQPQPFGQSSSQSSVQGGAGLSMSMGSTYQSPAFDPAPVSYGSLLGLGTSAPSSLLSPGLSSSLSEPYFGLSTSSLSSSLATSSLVSGLNGHYGGGSSGGLHSQLSGQQPSPLRHSPLPYAGGYSQSPASSSYELSVGHSYPNAGLSAGTSQLLSEMPMSSSSLPSYSAYSSYPPAVPLAPSHTLQHQHQQQASLMKPVPRRADEGMAAAGSALLGGLSSLSLQQLRSIGMGDYRQ